MLQNLKHQTENSCGSEEGSAVDVTQEDDGASVAATITILIKEVHL